MKRILVLAAFALPVLFINPAGAGSLVIKSGSGKGDMTTVIKKKYTQEDVRSTSPGAGVSGAPRPSTVRPRPGITRPRPGITRPRSGAAAPRPGTAGRPTDRVSMERLRLQEQLSELQQEYRTTRGNQHTQQVLRRKMRAVQFKLNELQDNPEKYFEEYGGAE